MNISQDIRRGSVTTLDIEDFEIVCRRLMTLVRANWHPDVLVGIRTGGYHVAEVMARADVARLKVLPITCRRPSTRLKLASSLVRKLMSTLPRPFVDRLRIIEHALLTRKVKVFKRTDYQFDQAELAILDAWLEKSGRRPAILIVDDSVDTGATLAAVIDVIRTRAPHADIRAATITVTTSAPMILPDYTLFHRKLCRFPWSIDSQNKPAQ